MLEDVAKIRRVVLACGTVDLRKGIDGLSMIIGDKYHQNPFEKGTLFLFCGRRADRIKGLVFEGDGTCLLYKRLAPGSRFQWPRTPEEAREITPEQYRRLMDGFTIEGTIREVCPKLQPETSPGPEAAGCPGK